MTIGRAKINIPEERAFHSPTLEGLKNLEELTLENMLVFAGAVALQLID